MIETAVMYVTAKDQAFRLSQVGARVTVMDLYRRRPVETRNFADEKAAFAALCCLRAEIREEMKNGNE